MPLKLITAPVGEPVALADVKTALKVEHSREDAFLEELITAVREELEAYLERQCLTATWDYYPVTPPAGVDVLEIPRSPLQSIVSVTSYTDADVATVLGTDQYYADVVNEPGALVLRSAGAWPTDLRARNALVVRFIAGYGLADAVPRRIKAAITRLVAFFFRNRGDVVVTDDTLAQLPDVASLLTGLRRESP